MSRLECAKCKAIFQDVVRVRKCPLCGCMEFSNVEPGMAMARKPWPKWFTYQGSLGYVYHQSVHPDASAMA